MNQGFLLLLILIKKQCAIAWVRDGEKERRKERRREGDKEEGRYFQAIHVVGNALACYSSPIHMCPSSRIIP